MLSAIFVATDFDGRALDFFAPAKCGGCPVLLVELGLLLAARAWLTTQA
jgi:hypothetical protein